MLEQGHEINACDYDNRSALMLACVKGNGEIHNDHNMYSMYSMYGILWVGGHHCVMLPSSDGTYLAPRPSPFTLLPASCVRTLLESGADPHLRDSTGSCAMMEACKSGNATVVADLLRYGARLNMEPSSLAGQLCRAVYEGDMRLLYRLVHAGANVSISDYDGRTALHVACAEGNLAAVSVYFWGGGHTFSRHAQP